jgi:hypothetical protein
MPRNAPGAVRVAPRTAVKVRPVDGLSSRANAAILELQALRPGIGDVGTALRTYRDEIRRAGRWLALATCCPRCDVLEQRDTLAAALHALPPFAARELRRIVAALDEEFLRKTLPDPRAAGPWWRRRIDER